MSMTQPKRWYAVLGATLALSIASLVHAQETPEIEIAPGLRVKPNPSVPGTFYVLAGVDAKSGRTRWVTPRRIVSEVLGNVPQDAVTELLEQGWHVVRTTESGAGDIVVLVLRQP